MSTTVKTTEVVKENVQPETTSVLQPVTESGVQPVTVEDNADNTDDVNKAKDDKEAERANDVGAEVSPSSTVTLPAQ